MEFGVLGDVEVWAGGVRVDVGHARQRAVLAVLLFGLGRVVPTSQLVDRVWGDDPPVTVRNVLYGYIARLRAAIAGAADPAVTLCRQPGGYRLEAGPDQVDLYRFRRLAAEAAAVAGDDDRAGALLAGALALWRGSALAGMDSPWLNGMRESLELQRRAAVLDLGDIMLRQGRHAALATDLAAEAVTCPADERLIGQLMLALYRSGQQAEALHRFEQARQRLAEEFGADPGPQLQALHQQILRADLSLAPAGHADDISLSAHSLPDCQAGRPPPPAGAAAAPVRRPQLAVGYRAGPGAVAVTRLLAWRPGRAGGLVTLAGAALAVVLSVFYAGFPAGTAHPGGDVRAAGTSPDGVVLHDGVSPVRAGCGSDAVTLASAPVRLPGPAPGTIGKRLGSGMVLGRVQLRYSAACHATWARFQPAPAVGIRPLRVLVWQIRASDGMRLAVQVRAPGAGDTGVLMTGHDCALAGVFITPRTGPEAMTLTRCVTARAMSSHAGR